MTLADELNDLADFMQDLADFMQELLDREGVTDPWWRNQVAQRVADLRDLLL